LEAEIVEPGGEPELAGLSEQLGVALGQFFKERGGWSRFLSGPATSQWSRNPARTGSGIWRAFGTLAIDLVGILLPLGKMEVGDTGFEPVTSSVSVISGAHDNAAVGVTEVRGCTQMIAGRRTD